MANWSPLKLTPQNRATLAFGLKVEIPVVSVPDVTFVPEGNSDLETSILSSNDNDSIGSHSTTAERATPDQYSASTEQNTVQPEPTVTGDSAQSSSDQSEHTDHQKNEHTDQPSDQTQAPNREKLLDRIRKLFAMAQETEASPHEAEIALRRCQSLMSRYGISETDLLTSQFSTEAFRAGNRVPMFVRWLASAVQNLHSVLFVSGGSEPPEFRGFDIDVKVAMMTMDYLENAVERALATRRRSGTFPPGRSAAYDYRVSFAMEVNCRVQTLVDERKAAEAAAAVTGISLTVRKMEIVDAECGQGLVSGASYRGARPGEAAEAGRTDGSKVSLDPQVDTNKDTRGRKALFSGVSY